MTTGPTINALDTAQDEPVLQAIGDAVAKSDLAHAALLADAALSSGREHPAFFNARALWHEKEGRFEEALANFRNARALSPQNFNILDAMGLSLCRTGRYREAIAVFDEAIPINPSYGAVHFHKGWACELAGDFEAAQQCYERAVVLAPTLVEALAALAAILLKKGDTGLARSTAERALALDPGQPGANLALSEVEISESSFAAAETRLRKLLQTATLAPQSRAIGLGLLGDALDGLGKDAFAKYTEQNRELQKLYAPRFANARPLAEMLGGLIAHLENAEPAPRPDDGARDGAGTHVFLAGFPRSGAVRVAQLMAHEKKVVALETPEYLAEPARMFLGDGAGLSALAALGDPLLTQIRQDYWQLLRNNGIDVTDRIVLDKLPLNAIRLPLIAKLFPGAKIVFCVRDPRDVVLSCFRRHFDSNAAMYEMLTLDGAARAYDAAMRFAALCREKFSLQILEHRHEALLEDTASAMRKICDFAGLEWREDMATVMPNRRAEGASHWRRYAKELAPVIPTLQPWIAKFGYKAE